MSFNRRKFLKTIGAAGAALVAGQQRSGGQRAEGRRLNILHIMTDQQPVSCTGAYGNEVINTPNLDELAARGATFDRFYIAAFPCSPSRASMLSGRYAHNHGVLTNDVLFDADVPCLGDVCQAAGYETGYFGKWHLGGFMYRGRPHRKGDGLKEWYLKRVRTDDGFTFEPVEGGLGEDSPQHGFETWRGGWKHYHDYLREVGWGDFLDAHPATGNHNDAPSGPEGTHIHSQLPQQHHVAAFLAKEANRFIREHGGETQPWCAALSFYGPHLPVAPPKPWDEMYSLDEVELPANHNDDLQGKPIRQRTNERIYKLPDWTDEQFKDYIRRYWGYCSYIDHQIGRVFRALDETNQWDNTIVLFTSDHGDMVAAHGMVFKLGACGYEELFRVPTFLHIPGVTEPGSRVDALASNIDLLPTVLEACGIDEPDGVDGKSLLPLLAGTTEGHRDIIFSDSINHSIVCRDERYKFVLNWWRRDMDELYDLEADPGEMNNLAYEEEHEETAAQLRERCLRWARDTGHPYAELIATQAAKEPETKILEVAAEGEKFKYLGGNEFEIGIVWHVDEPIEAEGKYWAFTQFLNPKYGTDGPIVFRFTPYPETPIQDWEAGEDHHIGPVRVQVPDHAGPGEYTVYTGFHDPDQHKGPGVILPGSRSGMEIGTLVIEKEDGEITDIRYWPKGAERPEEEKKEQKEEKPGLDIRAEAEKFEYLGDRKFQLGIAWHVNETINAEGRYWNFTQFLNPEYGTDHAIAFRFTPYPETPIQQWQPGEVYHVGPETVAVPKTAGPGEYEVRTGLWDPDQRKRPGNIAGHEHHFMKVGTLIIECDADQITNIRFEPIAGKAPEEERQAETEEKTRVIDISAEGEKFTYLGGRDFQMGVVWHVNEDIDADGKYWAFTQFINEKYGRDGAIAFRFTPFPETPVTEWKAGNDYHIGPETVTIPESAGPGEYKIRTGLWDPDRHEGPGTIKGHDDHSMMIGTLIVEGEDGEITGVRYEP